MKTQFPSIAALALCCASLPAVAGQFDYTGSLQYDNSVAHIQFTVVDAVTSVQFWTDSYHGGSNFDPSIQLWSSPSGAFVGSSDDYGLSGFTLKVGQTDYDAGFGLSALSQGTYVLTIIAYPNFAVGATLAEGFISDASTGSLLGSAGHYSAHIAYEGGAITTPVPEPQSYALMLAGLAAVGWAARRRA
jgi:hypothetical protein